MTGKKLTDPDQSSVVVVVVEVEERIAVIPVDPHVFAGQCLEADAGMLTEFGRLGAQVAGTVDCLDLAAVPAWPAEQEWSNAAAAHAQEERRLYGGLGDFLIGQFD